MIKKYELILDDTIDFFGQKLFRIRALTSFGNVEAGDLGGYIQKEENLSENGDAWVYDDARVSGDTKVSGNARVSGNAWVSGDTKVYGNARVYGDAEVSGDASVSGDAKVYGNAKVSGNAWVCVHAEVYGDAKIISQNDYIVFKNSWSSFRWFTYTKSNKMWKVGCFYGTGQELIEKAYADSEDSGNHYKVYVDCVEALEKLSEQEDK